MTLTSGFVPELRRVSSNCDTFCDYDATGTVTVRLFGPVDSGIPKQGYHSIILPLGYTLGIILLPSYAMPWRWS
jgi:hypothetical protein